MADTTTESQASTAPSRGSNQNRGGRQRGQRGPNPSANADGHTGGGGRGGGRRGGQRGGNRGERRGGQGRNQPSGRPHASSEQADRRAQPPDRVPPSEGTSGDRPTGDAFNDEGEAKSKPVKRWEAAVKAQKDGGDEDADDGEVCFICASNVAHTSVSPCNHRTCHICALRLRALYKAKTCAHCRTESNFVIFTDDPARKFEDFSESDFVRSDDNLGIKYERDEIFEDTVLLLRYNCPDEDCDVACLGWPDLHRHVKSKHGKVMCDLCTRYKKVFTHEHDLFSPSELRKHEKFGDDNPGAIDQSGFKGHPECGFCRQRFYGDDELYAHCRDKHERCHICDRAGPSRQQQYYVNYDALEEHFNKDHFVCLEKECLEKKFVVFESQMDLKAHQLESHPSGLSKDVRRDARVVDISSFDYRTPYQPQRQRRDGRGAGRGRDPNSEPLPPSSAQPMRRDEMAYQRQMAVQSAQSVSTRSFGGQLTPSDVQTVRAPARPSAPPRPTPAQEPPVSTMEALNIEADNVPATPQQQARRLRHASVIDRASTLLRNDPSKISNFRSKVSSYQASAITATNLIDAFFSLFDTSSTELGKLVKELADIYEDESKRSALLKAWNDWRAINEDYPALPGPNGILPGLSPNTVNGSGAGGKRVLRLKSSTAQSSRSAVGRSGSASNPFDTGSRPRNNLASDTNPFPPLSSGSSAASRRGVGGAAWGTAAPQTRSSRASPASSHPPSRSGTPASRRTAGDSDAFPALPAAPKPNTLMAGLTRGTVRWNNNESPGASAWGASGDANPHASEPELGGEGEGGKKSKGKKGKGQLLFHFG
ncbi:hypothetical protein FQN54_007111 [Arachnomyces sp. PD_36]|nr:hypothetical protein FQN54_007111 [Arachnomyces sp. PD_36]